MAVLGTLKHAWNAFLDQPAPDPIRGNALSNFGVGYATRPDRGVRNSSNERSLVSSIYTRLGIDAAG